MNIQRIGRISIGFAALCMGSAYAGELVAGETRAASPGANARDIRALTARVTALEAAGVPGANPVPTGASNFIFVTSEDFTGAEVGGVAGADAHCNRLAGPTLQGTYRAWIGDGAQGPADPITTYAQGSGPYVLPTPTGTVTPLTNAVANDFAGLIGATPANVTLMRAIDVTESGNALPAPDATATPPTTANVWTSVISDGFTASANNCTNWTVTTTTGEIGDFTSTTSTWTEQPAAAPAIACNTKARLYCLGQATTVAP